MTDRKGSLLIAEDMKTLDLELALPIPIKTISSEQPNSTSASNPPIFHLD